MISNAGIAALGFALLPAVAAGAPSDEWRGRYVWEEPLGRIGGSTPPEGAAAFVNRTLTLGRSAGPTGCSLDVEGFQSDDHMRCTAEAQGKVIIVKFALRAPGARGEEYPRGAPLFTLQRTSRGLVTKLLAMHPSSDATSTHGHLFSRVR